MKAPGMPINIKMIGGKDRSIVAQMRPVTSVDVFEGKSSTPHDDGVYSTLIFGRLGEERRMTSFSYVPLKAPIMHPTLYQSICKLRSLYKDIIAGKRYATWDSKLKDFVPSDPISGSTGYSFFIRHLKELNPPKTKSDERTQHLQLLKAGVEAGLLTFALVIPAGMRDYQVDTGGRLKEEEINDLYKKLIGINNTIVTTTDEWGESSTVSASYDQARAGAQNVLNELYNLLKSWLFGKKGILQAKYASRRVVNGTRNVLSSLDPSSLELGTLTSPSVDQLRLGLQQIAVGALDKVIYLMRSNLLSEIFDTDGEVSLFNDKKQKVSVQLTPEDRDLWNTVEGLTNVVDILSDTHQRVQPAMVAGHYVALIYRTDKHYKIVRDTSNLPEHVTLDQLIPLRYTELVYLTCYREMYDWVGYMTRYPVAGLYSSVPSMVYCKTTMVAESLTALDDEWKPIEDDVAREVPTFGGAGGAYMDSQIPHIGRLQGYAADFDGDTGPAVIAWSIESQKEVQGLVNSDSYLIDPTGGLMFDLTAQGGMDFIYHNLTKGLK